jgi:hypothetical protein
LHHLLSETNEIQRQAQIEENISPIPLSREEEEKEQATPVAVPSLSLSSQKEPVLGHGLSVLKQHRMTRKLDQNKASDVRLSLDYLDHGCELLCERNRDANKRDVLLQREESKAAIATATTPVK